MSARGAVRKGLGRAGVRRASRLQAVALAMIEALRAIKLEKSCGTVSGASFWYINCTENFLSF